MQVSLSLWMAYQGNAQVRAQDLGKDARFSFPLSFFSMAYQSSAVRRLNIPNDAVTNLSAGVCG
jgi:hypothetical protein